jgi:hypothetical protein
MEWSKFESGRNLLLAITSVAALVLFIARRRVALWWWCCGVWATAIVVIGYKPWRVANYTPVSFDDLTGGIQIVVEDCLVTLFLVPMNFVLFAMVVLSLGSRVGRNSDHAVGLHSQPQLDFSKLPRFPGPN